MSKKVGKGDIHFQPKWGQVLLSLLVIAGAVWLFWWCIWGTPLTGAPKVVVAVLVILLDCLLCFSAGMNLIFNFYSRGVWATLEEMWQQPDSVAPGDFWAWSYGGFGAEVADVVPNKYIVWFCDTTDPVRTPGAAYMQTPGKKYVKWYWTIALFPLDGGKRCRIINGWDTAYGPHNPINWWQETFIIGYGGAMMGRRMFRNLELAAVHKRRKSIPLRLQAGMMGRCWKYDERLHDIIAYPELRWSRECPRVEAKRAPFTDDPN